MSLKKHALIFVSFLLIGVLLIFPTSISASAILLNDDFDDGSATDGNPVYWEEMLNNNNWSVQNGKYTGSVEPNTGINPRTLAGDLGWRNYAFEISVRGVSGYPRHILFRFDQNRAAPKGYAIKFVESANGSSGYMELQRAGQTSLIFNNNFRSRIGDTNRIRVEGYENNVKVYANGEIVIDYTDTAQPIYTGKIGLLVESDTQLGSTTEYDDALVESLDQPNSSPTASPTASPTPSPAPTLTPSPTPTPTPGPTPPGLNVPLIKQAALPWGNQIYDTATNWSSSPYISRWGCALTSAAMVLQYWGHQVDPSSLNTWLNNQADGYLGNGLVNWLAITRYTTTHQIPGSKILEYTRLGNDFSLLSNELVNGRPGILKLPGHFVVGKGEQNGDYLINDPGFNRNSLAEYGGSYLALNKFRPTSTDLSYIMLVVNPEASISVQDTLGNPVMGTVFTDEPLIDDVNTTDTSGRPLKLFLLPTPTDGVYEINVSGFDGMYELNSYLYDQDGNVTPSTFGGIVSTDKGDSFQVNYSDTPTTYEVVTIQAIIQDLNEVHNQDLITNNKFFRLVHKQLMEVKRLLIARKKRDVVQAKGILNMIITELQTFTSIFINPQASQILQDNLGILINSL